MADGPGGSHGVQRALGLRQHKIECARADMYSIWHYVRVYVHTGLRGYGGVRIYVQPHVAGITRGVPKGEGVGDPPPRSLYRRTRGVPKGRGLGNPPFSFVQTNRRRDACMRASRAASRPVAVCCPVGGLGAVLTPTHTPCAKTAQREDCFRCLSSRAAPWPVARGAVAASREGPQHENTCLACKGRVRALESTCVRYSRGL